MKYVGKNSARLVEIGRRKCNREQSEGRAILGSGPRGAL
jgi:hypothetical protein